MRGYKLSYEAEEIDNLLKTVDEKTVYDDATTEESGLMSAEDKKKLDDIGTMSNEDIDNAITDAGHESSTHDGNGA